MPKSPIEVVQAVLADPTNPDVVNALIAADATYVSLNYDNPELKKIMPWTGTQTGPQAVIDTYSRVSRYWKNEAFEIGDIFESDGKVAVFGSFSYRSTTLGKAVTSPFSIFVKVSDGKVTYMQFMEDTFGTAATFRSSGATSFRSDPEGSEVTI